MYILYNLEYIYLQLKKWSFYILVVTQMNQIYPSTDEDEKMILIYFFNFLLK